MRKRIATPVLSRTERMKNYVQWRIKNLMSPLTVEEFMVIRAKI